MPAPTLTVSKTLGGADVSDTLQGGGSGVDVGGVTPGSYTPVVAQAANSGSQILYLRHDSGSPITNLSAYIQPYGTGTAFTYGGASSAANDYATLKSLGNASGTSKNNADGLSGGLWMDMLYTADATNLMDIGSRPTQVKIFGRNNTDGIDVPSAYIIKASAMLKNVSGSEGAPSGAVDGKVGASGDATLGDVAKLQFRLYKPTASAVLGTLQWETVFSYSQTA